MKKSIDKKIYEARKTLRNLHQKYQKELFEITNKIDKYLEAMQNEKRN